MEKDEDFLCGKYRTSNIEHRTSNIERRTPNAERWTPKAELSVSDAEIEPGSRGGKQERFGKFFVLFLGPALNCDSLYAVRKMSEAGGDGAFNFSRR